MTEIAPLTVLTIGHSNHSYERFLSLLRQAQITAIADVRSSPYSSRNPHFSGENLKARLRRDGVAYSFLGKQLGGRPREPRLFRHGVADYEAMASTEAFRKGLDRLMAGARDYRIALMCSEGHPLDCHRCLLVGRALAEQDVEVSHILPDGRVVSQMEIENRLLKLSTGDNEDLFVSRYERLANAYRERASKVAFTEPASDENSALARRA